MFSAVPIVTIGLSSIGSSSGLQENKRKTQNNETKKATAFNRSILVAFMIIWVLIVNLRC